MQNITKEGRAGEGGAGEENKPEHFASFLVLAVKALVDPVPDVAALHSGILLIRVKELADAE